MGLWANLLALFKDGPHGQARQLTWGRVDRILGWDDRDPRPLDAGAGYFQVFLQEMWLPNDRDWINTYAPLVYSSTRLRFGSKTIEIPYITGNLEVGTGRSIMNMQVVLNLNHPLTGVLPYNGGTVELAAGLAALRTGNGLQDIIAAATELTGVLKVPGLSAALDVITPVANTLDAVLSQGEDFVLGLHQSFGEHGGDRLAAGYYVTLGWPENTANLMVHHGRLCWLDGRPVVDKPFMVFRIETSPSRSDQTELSAIYDPLEQATTAAANDNIDGAEAWLKAGQLAAFRSDDLTRADRRRVALHLREEYELRLEALGISGDGAGSGDRVPQPQMPVERALDMSDTDVLAMILQG